MPEIKDKKPGDSGNNKKRKRGHEKKEEEKKPEPSGPFDSNFWSIILLAFTVFIALTAFVEGTDGWLSIHNFVRGLFGVSIILAVPVLVYASYLISKEKKKETIVTRFIQGALLLFLVSSIVQVVFIGDIPGEDFDEKINMLYANGTEMKSAGVISAVIGVPLVSLLGATGAKITIVLAFLVIILFVKNISVEKIFSGVKKGCEKVRTWWDSFKDGEAWGRYEREVIEGEKYEIEENAPVKEIKVQEKKKKEQVPLMEREVRFEEIKNIYS